MRKASSPNAAPRVQSRPEPVAGRAVAPGPWAALAYFDPESIAVIDALNAQAALRARVDEIIDEVVLELAEQLITAEREELVRREGI